KMCIKCATTHPLTHTDVPQSTDFLRKMTLRITTNHDAADVVFGGGNPEVENVAFGGAQILKASTGGLTLLNSGGVVTLRDSSAAIITFLSYGGSTGLRGDENQSLTRAPDITGNFTLHQSATESGGTLFSPGTYLNGNQFPPSPAISL